MLNYLYNNWGTIVAVAAIVFIVSLAVRKMVLDKKAGIGTCGQKCANCPHCSQCHK